MSCYLGLDSKKDCRGTPCRSCTANEPSAASVGYERRVEKADKHIQDLHRLYAEWRESKDEGLVSAIFKLAVAAINAATSS